MSTIERYDVTPRLAGAVTYAGMVFLSGQVPDDANADITTQTRQVLNKIDQLLAQTGSSRDRVLSAQIWLTDISADFAAMNAEWDAWLPAGTAPARATVQAALARPGLKVEIMITAALNPA